MGVPAQVRLITRLVHAPCFFLSIALTPIVLRSVQYNQSARYQHGTHCSRKSRRVKSEKRWPRKARKQQERLVMF